MMMKQKKKRRVEYENEEGRGQRWSRKPGCTPLLLVPEVLPASGTLPIIEQLLHSLSPSSLVTMGGDGFLGQGRLTGRANISG